MPLNFGRVTKRICDDPASEALAPRQLDQPEPFGHKRTHRLLDRPDVNLGGAAVPLKEKGGKIWSVLQARGQSVETEEVLITLGLEHDASDLPDEVDRRLDLIAIIKWGQGAAHFRAEVDWKNGVQISVPCAFIEVDTMFLEPSADGTFRKAHVAAAYAWGSSANRSFPTRTFPQLEVTELAPVILRIPPFAYSVIAYFDDAIVELDLLGGPLATDRLFQTIDTATLEESRLTEGVKLPGAARFVQIRNTGAGAALVTVMFGLNL